MATPLQTPYVCVDTGNCSCVVADASLAAAAAALLHNCCCLPLDLQLGTAGTLPPHRYGHDQEPSGEPTCRMFLTIE